MKAFLKLCNKIIKGKSVLRSFLELKMENEVLTGSVLDVGGGRNNNCVSFMSREDGALFSNIDKKAGFDIDFEKDKLPVRDNEHDTVLVLNVLEHIYNYKHLICEILRVTKRGGRVIGFTPFLMWYHPDHSDYFRYTHEALERIFDECGIKKEDLLIEKICRGPFTAASHMMTLSLPSFIRVFVFAIFYGLDSIFLLLRPKSGERYVLGYYFTFIR